MNRITTNIDVDYTDINELIGIDGRFHYLYKIIDLVTDKFYIGIHSTKNIYDNYKGSGTIINRMYKKYGVDRFEKHIFEFVESRTILLKREGEIVDKLLTNDCNCYNIIPGGQGSHLNNTKSNGRHNLGKIHILIMRKKIN